MESINLKCYSKVNLSLDVTGKREDGYHLLKMIMQNINIYDEISIKKNNDNMLNVVCSDVNIPSGEKNIVYKVAREFLKRIDSNEGFDIYIKKFIPSEAGMGGGSADAAGTLIGLNKIYNDIYTKQDLKNISLPYGADIPFFFDGGTCLAEGIGEVLTKLPDFKAHMLVIKPSKGISTVQSYKKLDINNLKYRPDTEGIIKAIEQNDIYNVCKNMGNVLYEPSSKILPEIEHYVNEIGLYKGCIKSMMTGSGSTVFGIFEREEDVKEAKEYFMEKYGENISIFQSETTNKGVEIL